MSNISLDSVATTLQDLKDIVHRNHSEAAEASILVQDMERLIAEMKTRATQDNAFTRLNETSISLPNTSIVHAI